LRHSPITFAYRVYLLLGSQRAVVLQTSVRKRGNDDANRYVVAQLGRLITFDAAAFDISHCHEIQVMRLLALRSFFPEVHDLDIIGSSLLI
jgi:hypothetical protein